jgi:ankyrin repeat protein
MAKKAFNSNSSLPSERQIENFWRAAAQGNEKLVTNFLRKFGNEHINDKFNNNQKTPLMYAATYNHPKVVEVLIKNGARLDLISGGTSAVDWAVMSRSIDSLEVLAKAGADINRKNFIGATALHMAMDMSYSFSDANPELARQNDSLRATKILIAAGANQFAKDSKGRTPRDIAVDKGRKDLVATLDEAASKKQAPKTGPRQSPATYSK